MTPNQIEILLHCYTTPVRHPQWMNVSVSMELFEFVKQGILKEHRGEEDVKFNGTYRCTDRGLALVKCLLSVPYPEVVYLDAHGQKIEIDEMG